MNRSKLMMYYFVGSEAFFFLTLIVTYVFYSHPGGKLSETAQYLDVEKTGIFTVFLVLSSVTIYIGEHFHKKGNTRALRWSLTGTIVLGLIFLIGQSIEYNHLFNLDVTISKDVFGSSFFTLTGFHGFHVLIGLIVLSVINGLFYSEKYRKLGNTALASASIYWHFVDAVWIVVFSVVYIGSIV
jgi:cytochrome c oxidase subunit 3